MSPRVYERKFDWDEARHLRAGGLTYAAIAERFGVTTQAVVFACDDEARARQRVRHAAWRASGRCADCGTQNTKDSERCIACAGKARRTRFRYDASGQLIAVRCAICKSWKPSSEYAKNAAESEGLHAQCRNCNTAMKRRWRAANREWQRASDREYRRRRRAQAKVAA